jgi:pimeloyl-ACP methyl ester carboxylesterase
MTSRSEPSARHDRGAAASGVTAGLEHRTVRVNGVGLHLAMQGTGPLVLLCHGWPELWYAWRHQIPALAAAGYRAAALDLRGFGGSDAPAGIEAYTMMHLVGDVVGLIGALGERQAVVVGHDWGANVAWYAALFRPDLVRAVVAMSVPFARRPPAPPVRALREAGQARFYWVYFQEPGAAEAEFESDPAATLRRILFGGSGEGQEGRTPEAGLTLPSSASRSSPSWLPSIGGRDSGAGSTSIGTSTGTGRCWHLGRMQRCVSRRCSSPARATR